MSSKRKIEIFSAGCAACEETVVYRSGRFYAVLILLVGIGLALVAPETARAATITVNTLADDSTASDGLCSLRKAINNATAPRTHGRRLCCWPRHRPPSISA